MLRLRALYKPVLYNSPAPTYSVKHKRELMLIFWKAQVASSSIRQDSPLERVELPIAVGRNLIG